MKTIIQVILSLVLLTVNLQAQKFTPEEVQPQDVTTTEESSPGSPTLEQQTFSYDVVDDEYRPVIEVVSPSLESAWNDGRGSVHWSISGTVNRTTGERTYAIVWFTIYRSRRYDFHDVNDMVLPGARVIEGRWLRRDGEVNRGEWTMVEMWVADIPESVITTLDRFRLRGTMVGADCAVPSGYLEGLTDIMMEYSE